MCPCEETIWGRRSSSPAQVRNRGRAGTAEIVSGRGRPTTARTFAKETESKSEPLRFRV